MKKSRQIVGKFRANEKGWYEKYAQVLKDFYLEHVLLTSINRVQRQSAKEKREVVKKMRQTVVRKNPQFYRSAYFRQMPTNRKIVALLNGVGLSGLSRILVDLKSKAK